MILSYSIYLLLIVLFIIGIKFAGFGNKFNDDFLDFNATKAISGIAVICIILHHISQRDAFQNVTHELFFFNDIGFLITTVFLFNSGYGLTISAKNNPNYMNNFARKRLPKILVPFVLSNIIFSIIAYINGEPLVKCLIGLTGLIAINPNGWFPITLLILYAVFAFNQKKIKNDYFQILNYVFVIIILYSIFCINGHYAWWSGENGKWLSPAQLGKKEWWQQMQILLFSGEWWVNSAISFVVGVVFGKRKDFIVNWLKKGYLIKLIVFIGMFVGSYLLFRNVRDVTHGYWSEYAMIGPGIDDKFITSAANFLVPVFFIISLEMILMKVRSENRITRFLGTISFETYLYGNLVITSFEFLIVESKYGQIIPIVKQPYNWNLILYAFIVIIVSLLIGLIMNKIDNFIIKKISNK